MFIAEKLNADATAMLKKKNQKLATKPQCAVYLYFFVTYASMLVFGFTLQA